MKWITKKIIWTFALVIYSLPQKIRHCLGDFIGILWFDVFRIRRSIVLGNIRRAFPDITNSEKIHLGRQSLRNMGRSFMDYPLMPFLNKKNRDDYFELKGEAHLKKAKEEGRGAFLLTMHLGSPDLGTVGLALFGYPLSIISKEFKIKWINEAWFNLRRKMGSRFIPPKKSSYHILKALKNNELVVFALDQYMGPRKGVRTRFFGHETGTAEGLSILASRSGVPVLPTYTYRDSQGKNIIVVEGPILTEEKSTREETQAHMTQVYTDRIEEIVRQHPEQWMWVHRRWKPFNA